MTRILLTLPLLIIGLVNTAQTSFAPGYIVNDKGDTIKGEVRLNPKKEHEVYSKVFFKDLTGIQKNYRPEKIRAYGVNNDHYVSLLSDGEPVFYKMLTSGYINFYRLEYETIKMNKPVFEFEYYFSDPTSKKHELIPIKEAKFKKQLSEYMQDNPEFLQAYPDDAKRFDYQKALEIISNYNTWKATQ